MATMAPAAAYTPQADSYAGESGLWAWLTTVDHKRIGTLYLFTSLFFFIVGGLEAGLIRLQLAGPTSTCCRPKRTTRCSRCTAPP